MSEDRDYYFLARAIDAAHLSDEAVVRRLKDSAMPVWRKLHDEGALVNVRTFRKVGVVGLGSDNNLERTWRLFSIAEIGEGCDAEAVAESEIDALKDMGLYDDADIDILCTELLMRRAGAGVAVPRPSKLYDRMPSNFTTAIEYIYKRPGCEEAYSAFMRDIFGPVGCAMVECGHAYSVTITDRVKVYNKDISIPDWNDIHILVGDFDDPQNGFTSKAGQTISKVLGFETDAASALEPAEKMRHKVLMSKNIEIAELCLGAI
ncbi:MAG: hypothetical protein AAGC95_03505 [Pseudomonadota bacterium]